MSVNELDRYFAPENVYKLLFKSILVFSRYRSHTLTITHLTHSHYYTNDHLFVIPKYENIARLSKKPLKVKIKGCGSMFQNESNFTNVILPWTKEGNWKLYNILVNLSDSTYIDDDDYLSLFMYHIQLTYDLLQQIRVLDQLIVYIVELCRGDIIELTVSCLITMT